jgi:glycosyltransferase involved in cell wall biosynthesis
MNGIAGLAGRLIRGTPIYVDCDDFEAVSNRFSSKWQRSVVSFCEDQIPLRASGATANTHFSVERLRRLGVPESRTIYVPNGVDVEYIRQLAQSRQCQVESRPTVIYVGSLSLSSHPVDLLVEAFSLVRKREPSALLRLVGDGDSRSRIEAEVARLGLTDSVEFIGHVSFESAIAWLRTAWVSVDPVFDDDVARARSPLKVLEAMAAGVPVVTGRVGDRETILANGSAGHLVQPGSVTALAEGILEQLADSTRMMQIAEAAQARVDAYRWDRLVHRFLEVYSYV